MLDGGPGPGRDCACCCSCSWCWCCCCCWIPEPGLCCCGLAASAPSLFISDLRSILSRAQRPLHSSLRLYVSLLLLFPPSIPRYHCLAPAFFAVLRAPENQCSLHSCSMVAELQLITTSLLRSLSSLLLLFTGLWKASLMPRSLETWLQYNYYSYVPSVCRSTAPLS